MDTYFYLLHLLFSDGSVGQASGFFQYDRTKIVEDETHILGMLKEKHQKQYEVDIVGVILQRFNHI